jgi:hypothetical protein
MEWCRKELYTASGKVNLALRPSIAMNLKSLCKAELTLGGVCRISPGLLTSSCCRDLPLVTISSSSIHLLSHNNGILQVSSKKAIQCRYFLHLSPQSHLNAFATTASFRRRRPVATRQGSNGSSQDEKKR